MREDIIWNRPSWPLKGNPYKVIEQINNFFSEDIEHLNYENKDSYFKNKLIDENLTEEEDKALSILSLKST